MAAERPVRGRGSGGEAAGGVPADGAAEAGCGRRWGGRRSLTRAPTRPRATLGAIVPPTFRKAAPEVAERFRQREGATTEFPRAVFTEEMKDEGYTILCSADGAHPLRPARRHLPPLRLQPGAAAVGGPRRGGRGPQVREQRHLLSVHPGHRPDHGGGHVGRYDTDKLAVIITQTGGGCRATNYISLIRKALAAVGLSHIPVIALSFKDLGEDNPGFKITPKMLLQACTRICTATCS